MTWYANEIIGLGSSDVRIAIMADARLSQHAYHVVGSLDHAWHTPEVVHSLPAEGLLVVRPVCAPDSSCAAWHGCPVVDWSGFDDSNTRELVDRAQVVEAPGYELELPPPGLLAYLKQLALSTGMPFVFYSCATFGGTPEEEYACILGPREVVLVTQPSEAWSESPRTAIVEPSAPTRIVPVDLLKLALGQLSLEIPSSYFALHARQFPWQKYKLTPPATEP